MRLANPRQKAIGGQMPIHKRRMIKFATTALEQNSCCLNEQESKFDRWLILILDN